MGHVLTNSTSFRYAIEATELDGSRGIGFLPGEDPEDGGGALTGVPGWKDIEPNSITSAGATVEKIARNPIRRKRARLKGTISDLNSGFGYEGDVTVDSFMDYIEGFMFSKMTNADLIFRGAAATGDATDDYTVDALTAAQVAKLQFIAGQVSSLLYASGYLIAANNGVKTLNFATTLSDTALSVAEDLTDEAPPSNARLEIAGAEFPDGEVQSFAVAAAVASVSGRIGTLTFANVAPSTLGLSVGQMIYIQFPGSTVRGFARITAMVGAVLTVDRMDAALVDAPTVTGDDTRIYFGQAIKDVGSDSESFLQRTYQVEAEYPGLAADGLASGYEYFKGNFCNTISLTMGLSDKAVFSAEFVGTDTDAPSETRKVVASVSPADSLDPLGTEAFSTVSDFARLRVSDIDEDGLTTDFKSIELVISNNVTPEKVLNRLGARFMNYGDFTVDLSTQLLFDDGAVLDRIRQNTTTSLDMFLQNGDGVIAFGLPAMTLGDGSKDLPVGETVLINVTGQAFEDTQTGASLLVSFMPTVPS